MPQPTITIIPFHSAVAAPIKTLNYEWLQKYFRVEEGDEKSLSDPQGEIIDNGGFIYHAQMNGAIVGTASLLNKGGGTFEIGKMAVTAAAQGVGIGSRLLEHCIAEARQKGISKLILYSNTQLTAAIHLYKKYGFVETEPESGLYEPADIKMEKWL